MRRIYRAKNKAKAKTIGKMLKASQLTSNGRKVVVKRMISELN